MYTTTVSAAEKPVDGYRSQNGKDVIDFTKHSRRNDV